MTGRTNGSAFWPMLLGGSLLAMSTIGCNANKAQSMADAPAMPQSGNPPAMPAGQMTAGPMAAGAAGKTPQTSGSSGMSAGGSGGASSPVGAGGTDTTAGSGGSTAGTPADSPDAGALGAPDAGEVIVMHDDLGKGNGSDVVLMGDSWMSNTLQLEGTGGGIAPSLQGASGQPYRNYAVQGVMLLSDDSFGPAIPTQWDQAKFVNPDIKTVVMTGGGNDVIQNPGLQSDCDMDGDQCKEFRKNLIAALDKLWTQMASDGVQDIIYVRYAAKSTTMMTGSSTPMVPAICTSGKVRCHSLDTTDLVNGEIALDNIHPLISANDRMAMALVDMMQAEGMRR
jgi:hypothetical protein